MMRSRFAIVAAAMVAGLSMTVGVAAVQNAAATWPLRHGLTLPAWLYLACVLCAMLLIYGPFLVFTGASTQPKAKLFWLFVLWELVWGTLTFLSGFLIWIFDGGFGGFP